VCKSSKRSASETGLSDQAQPMSPAVLTPGIQTSRPSSTGLAALDCAKGLVAIHVRKKIATCKVSQKKWDF
jgi:hypothetical protein